MKVSKSMVHEELRSYFTGLSIFTFLSKRMWFIRLQNRLGNWLLRGKDIPGLDCEQRYVPGTCGGPPIRTRIYRPQDTAGVLPAVLYIHGGGYIAGLPEANPAVIRKFIETRPCVVIAPDYRKALESPYPAAFNDCYDTLLWIRDNASSLGVMESRVIIAGHSAGGGLAAAVTLKARDTAEVDVAFQMPIYPMIDDLQPSDPEREIEVPVWDTDMNRIGWGAYLSAIHAAGAEVPAYAAPARATDFSGLPPTISIVGTLEPFYQETLDYVQSLEAAGVHVAFEEYADCFHAFDLLAKTRVGAQALAFTFDRFGEFYDLYADAPAPRGDV